MTSTIPLITLAAASLLMADDVPPVSLAKHPAGQTRTFIVINRSLQSVTGRLESLRDGHATVLERGPGAPRVDVPAAAAFIDADRWGPGVRWNGSVIGESPAGESGTLVELTDGTLLVGDLQPTGRPDTDDRLVLMHKTLGHIDLTLDAVRRLAPAAAPPLRPAQYATPKKDTLIYANEDTLEGFVSGIHFGGSGTVATVVGGVLKFEHDGLKSLVELSRLREVRFASPPAKTRSPAVWLDDGSITTMLSLTMNEAEVRLQRDKDSLPAAVKPEAVAAAMLDPAAIVPLAPPTASTTDSPASPLRFGPAEPLGTRDLTLTEPGTVTLPLPEGATRIAGWLVLPEDCRQWGDAEVTLSLETTPPTATTLLKEAISGARPEVAFNLELPRAKGLKLRVTLTEGKYGPIQDRVTLRHVLIAK